MARVSWKRLAWKRTKGKHEKQTLKLRKQGKLGRGSMGKRER